MGHATSGVVVLGFFDPCLQVLAQVPDPASFYGLKHDIINSFSSSDAFGHVFITARHGRC